MRNFIQRVIENMKRTETSTTYNNTRPRMLHALLGIAGEAGELIDMVKQATFYNKPIETAACKDELGDVLWYLGLAVDDLAITENKTPEDIFEEILTINKAKLLVRYPEKYSDQQARVRDLPAESKAVHNTEKDDVRQHEKE